MNSDLRRSLLLPAQRPGTSLKKSRTQSDKRRAPVAVEPGRPERRSLPRCGAPRIDASAGGGVTVAGSEITLSGNVPSWADCSRAERPAWSAPGWSAPAVTHVDNLLGIAPEPTGGRSGG